MAKLTLDKTLEF